MHGRRITWPDISTPNPRIDEFYGAQNHRSTEFQALKSAKHSVGKEKCGRRTNYILLGKKEEGNLQHGICSLLWWLRSDIPFSLFRCVPTEPFTRFEPFHPSNDVFNVDKVRQSPDFKAPKLGNVRSGYVHICLRYEIAAEYILSIYSIYIYII